MRRVLLGLGLLLVAACQSAPPPAGGRVAVEPERPKAPPRVLLDIETLADDSFLGRAAGTPGGQLAAAFVERRFREIGIDGAFGAGFRQRVVLPTGGEGVNIVGQVPGTVFPQQAILVTAHFDGMGVRSGRVFNGADDNASGVAALLYLAEQFATDSPAHTILFAALDAEEIGLVGARTLADDPPMPLGAVLAVVNLDMVSRGPLWAAGTTHYPHLRPILERAASLRFGHDTGAGADNWTGASDHAVFHRRGIPFVYLGVENHPDYHQPTDDADRIDPSVLAVAVDAIVRVVRALDESHAALVQGR